MNKRRPICTKCKDFVIAEKGPSRVTTFVGGNFIELGDPIFCVAAEIQMPTLATGSGDATESKPISWEKPSPPPEVYRNTVTQQTFQRPDRYIKQNAKDLQCNLEASD